MIIVADTTIFSNLIKINQLNWLQTLFSSIIIPQKVHEEVCVLTSLGVDIAVFFSADWIQIRTITHTALYEDLLTELDAGEAKAITMAKEVEADLVLIDEIQGRRKATDLGLHVLGTIGVLVKLKELGIIDTVGEWLEKLKTSGFWINARFQQQILRDIGEI